MTDQPKKNLTPKQEKFCQEYLIDLNATQAAIRAGYSEKTAYATGHENLRKPDIQERLSKLRKGLEENTEVTQERIIKELSRIAFLDIRKFFNEDGSLKQITELDDDTAAAIAGMDVSVLTKLGNDNSKEVLKEFVKKIKSVDKKGALELLMKHLGMMANEKIDIRHTFEDFVD